MKLKLLLCAPLLLAVVACAGSGDDGKEDRSRELYNRSVRLMKSYIDSLRHLPDTVDVAGLMRRYEERMAALNMEFPPGTDMLMTPDLNDNLFKLTRVLTRLRMRHPGGMELIITLAACCARRMSRGFLVSRMAPEEILEESPTESTVTT